MKGPDHKFAIEPQELKLMIDRVRDIESAMGNGEKVGPRKEETEMFLKGRRSIHVNKNLKKGSTLKKNDLVIKRPGYGIIPSKFKKLIGKKLKKALKADQWLTWDMI